MTIVIDAQTPDRADASAEKLAERLRHESETIETVYDFAGDPFFRRNSLLYLGIDDLEDVGDRLSQAQGLLGALSEDTSLRGLSEAIGLAIDDMADGNEPIGDLTYVFERIADVVSARSQGTAAELSWRGLMAGEDFDSGDTRRFLQVRINSIGPRFRPPRLRWMRSVKPRQNWALRQKTECALGWREGRRSRQKS